MTFNSRMQITLEKCEQLARDPGATQGERDAASRKAEKLRAKLGGANEEYDGLVEEGRAIADEHESSMWRLGELAGRVDTIFGASSLKKYAEDIGVEYSTLKKAKSTALVWTQEGGRPPFWTAAALNAVPDREKIIARKPQITQREAREMARQRRKIEPSAPKLEKRAARAVKKRGTDGLGYFGEIVEVLNGMLDSGGNGVSLIRKADWSSVHARQGRKRVLKALQALRSRVDKEIAHLDSGDKLN